MQLVFRHFHVSHLIRRGGKKPLINFIGSKPAVAVAAYVHEYLVRAMRSAWKEVNDRRLKRDIFMHGFCWAIEQQMPEVFQDRSEALVPIFDDYIKKVILSPGDKEKTIPAPKFKFGASSSDLLIVSQTVSARLFGLIPLPNPLSSGYFGMFLNPSGSLIPRVLSHHVKAYC